MQFLNSEIAFLTKKRKTGSLVKQELSCGIFQDVEKIQGAEKSLDKKD